MKTEIGNLLDKNLKEKNEIEKKEKDHVFLTSPKQEKIKEKKDEIFNNEITQLEQRLSLDEMKNVAEELSLSSNRKANIVNKKFNLDDWSVQKNNSNEGRTYDSPPVDADNSADKNHDISKFENFVCLFNSISFCFSGVN